VYVPNTRARAILLQALLLPAGRPRGDHRRRAHNGGGSVADYYIDILRRPLIALGDALRRGPEDAARGDPGPKVMLIDETAGSGGDLLPWMFRQSKLGTLVGKRTWGGLVGILGFPVLMDGGTSPRPTSRSGPRTASSSRTSACRRTSRSSRRRPT
jgi:tricorn protease